MATDFVDPNADGTTLQWARYGPEPPETHWECVDDKIRQPTTTGFDGFYLDAEYDGQTDEIGFTTLTASSVSQVDVWIYHRDFGPVEGTNVQIYMGGAWQAAQFIAKRAAGWDSKTFSGTWTQTDLNNLQVRIIAAAPEGGELQVEEIYCVITYEVAPPVAAVRNQVYVIS